MADYLACSGTWSQGAGGVISCDTTATVVTELELAQSLLVQNQLDSADFGVLFGGAVLMLVTAYCIRQVRRLFETNPGRG